MGDSFSGNTTSLIDHAQAPPTGRKAPKLGRSEIVVVSSGRIGGGARGPLWTPLGRFSYALVAPVAFERPSAASFGREHARGLCPQYPPYNRNVAIYKIEPIRFSKGASLQQLVSNPGFPHAASSSREGCSKGSSREPQGHPKEFLVPLLAAIFFRRMLFHQYHFPSLTPPITYSPQSMQKQNQLLLETKNGLNHR